MKRRDEKVLEQLERARAIWTLHLQGCSNLEISDALGITCTVADLQSSIALVGAAYTNELAVEQQRSVEAARLNTLQSALWSRAVGTPFEDILQRFLETGDWEPEAVDMLRTVLENTSKDQRECVRLLLAISERRGKLLALDAQQPSINAVIMPTVQFLTAPPGARDLESNGVTIATEPVDPANL